MRNLTDLLLELQQTLDTGLLTGKALASLSTFLNTFDLVLFWCGMISVKEIPNNTREICLMVHSVFVCLYVCVRAPAHVWV